MALHTIYSLTPICESPAQICPLNSTRISNCLQHLHWDNYQTSQSHRSTTKVLLFVGQSVLPIGFSISTTQEDLEINSDASLSHIIHPICQQILLVLPSRKVQNLTISQDSKCWPTGPRHLHFSPELLQQSPNWSVSALASPAHLNHKSDPITLLLKALQRLPSQGKSQSSPKAQCSLQHSPLPPHLSKFSLPQFA